MIFSRSPRRRRLSLFILEEVNFRISRGRLCSLDSSANREMIFCSASLFARSIRIERASLNVCLREVRMLAALQRNPSSKCACASDSGLAYATLVQWREINWRRRRGRCLTGAYMFIVQ